MLRLMVMVKRLSATVVAVWLIAACAATEKAELRSADSPRVNDSPGGADASASPSRACADGTQPAALPSPPPAASQPAGSSTTNQVDLNIYADCTSVRVGQPVRLRIIASGSHHEPSISGFRIEGTTTASGPGCVPEDPNEQPNPGVTVQDVEHTYKKAGEDRVVVNAATFCSRFSGFDRAELVLDVRP